MAWGSHESKSSLNAKYEHRNLKTGRALWAGNEQRKGRGWEARSKEQEEDLVGQKDRIITGGRREDMSLSWLGSILHFSMRTYAQ